MKKTLKKYYQNRSINRKKGLEDEIELRDWRDLCYKKFDASGFEN